MKPKFQSHFIDRVKSYRTLEYLQDNYREILLIVNGSIEISSTLLPLN